MTRVPARLGMASSSGKSPSLSNPLVGKHTLIQPSQKNGKIYLENEIFISRESKNGDLPCRSLWNLVIYDGKNHVTKLEDLPTKGPFTAVAIAKDPTDTKLEFIGCTVIISPIMEYSMEYPYGKEAIVWLKSNRAFYRVMSVAPVYENVWGPLKNLLDLSGHTINVMLRSNLDMMTPYLVKKISYLAKIGMGETVERITTGRAFILDQIKNQQIAKLLKSQFYKELNNAKVWHQFRLSLNLEGPVNTATKKSKIEAYSPALTSIASTSSTSLPLSDKSKSSSKSSSSSVSSKSSASTQSKSKAKVPDTEKASSSKKAPRKLAAKPQIKVSSSSTFASSLPPREKKCFKPTIEHFAKPVFAKKTDSSKSILTPYLVHLEIPNEVNFDYACPYCNIMMEKSRGLPELLPRLRLHLRLHAINRKHGEPFSETIKFHGKSLKDRMELFIDHLCDNQTNNISTDLEGVMNWPQRPKLVVEKEKATDNPIGNSTASLIPLENVPKADSLSPIRVSRVISPTLDKEKIGPLPNWAVCSNNSTMKNPLTQDFSPKNTLNSPTKRKREDTGMQIASPVPKRPMIRLVSSLNASPNKEINSPASGKVSIKTPKLTESTVNIPINANSAVNPTINTTSTTNTLISANPQMGSNTKSVVNPAKLVNMNISANMIMAQNAYDQRKSSVDNNPAPKAKPSSNSPIAKDSAKIAGPNLAPLPKLNGTDSELMAVKKPLAPAAIGKNIEEAPLTLSKAPTVLTAVSIKSSGIDAGKDLAPTAPSLNQQNIPYRAPSMNQKPVLPPKAVSLEKTFIPSNTVQTMTVPTLRPVIADKTRFIPAAPSNSIGIIRPTMAHNVLPPPFAINRMQSPLQAPFGQDKKSPIKIQESSVDLTQSPRRSSSTIQSVDLCDSDDDNFQTVRSRSIDRLQDVSMDKCWRCGFRVSGRICSQCGSLQ